MERIYQSVDQLIHKVNEAHASIEVGGQHVSKEDVTTAAFLVVRVNELATAVANLNGSVVIRALSERPPGQEQAAGGHWSCPKCTAENEASAESCAVCLSVRAASTLVGNGGGVLYSTEEEPRRKSHSFGDEPSVASQINRIPDPDPLPEVPSSQRGPGLCPGPPPDAVPDLLPGLDTSGADVFSDPFDPFTNSLLKPNQAGGAPEKEKPLTRENSPSDQLGRTHEPETEQPVEHIDPFGLDVPGAHSSTRELPTSHAPDAGQVPLQVRHTLRPPVQPLDAVPTASAKSPGPAGAQALPQEEIDKRLEQWAKDGSQPRPIRSLLSKLDSVLPPALGFEAHPHFTKWASPSLGDILTGQQVRSVQREARLLLAPDKVRSKLDKEQGDVCEFLYQTINAAFVTFRQEELQT